MAASSGRLQSVEAAPVILREGRVAVAERGLDKHELLKHHDFVPQLLAPLTWCLHKVYNNQKKGKKTFRIQNVQVMLMSGIRQASKPACCAYKRGLHANKTTSVTFIID